MAPTGPVALFLLIVLLSSPSTEAARLRRRHHSHPRHRHDAKPRASVLAEQQILARNNDGRWPDTDAIFLVDDDASLEEAVYDDETSDLGDVESIPVLLEENSGMPTPESELGWWRVGKDFSLKGEDITMASLQAKTVQDHLLSMEKLTTEKSIRLQKIVRIQHGMDSKIIRLMEKSRNFRRFYFRMFGVTLSVLARHGVFGQDASNYVLALTKKLTDNGNMPRNMALIVYCVMNAYRGLPKWTFPDGSKEDLNLGFCAESDITTYPKRQYVKDTMNPVADTTGTMSKFQTAQYFRSTFEPQSRFRHISEIQLDDLQLPDMAQTDFDQMAKELASAWTVLAGIEERKSQYAGTKGWLVKKNAELPLGVEKVNVDAGPATTGRSSVFGSPSDNFGFFWNTWMTGFRSAGTYYGASQQMEKDADNAAGNTIAAAKVVTTLLNPSLTILSTTTDLVVTLVKSVMSTYGDYQANYNLQRSKFATSMAALLKETTEKDDPRCSDDAFKTANADYCSGKIKDWQCKYTKFAQKFPSLCVEIDETKRKAPKVGLNAQQAFDTAMQIFFQYGMSVPYWTVTRVQGQSGDNYICTSSMGCLFQAAALAPTYAKYKDSMAAIKTRLNFLATRNVITKSAELELIREQVKALLNNPTLPETRFIRFLPFQFYPDMSESVSSMVIKTGIWTLKGAFNVVKFVLKSPFLALKWSVKKVVVASAKCKLLGKTSCCEWCKTRLKANKISPLQQIKVNEKTVDELFVLPWEERLKADIQQNQDMEAFQSNAFLLLETAAKTFAGPDDDGCCSPNSDDWCDQNVPDADSSDSCPLIDDQDDTSPADRFKGLTLAGDFEGATLEYQDQPDAWSEWGQA